MKVVVTIIILFGIGLGYFLLNSSNQTPINESQVKPQPSSAGENQAPAQAIQPVAIPTEVLDEQEQLKLNQEKLQVAKQKLESLLQEYNDNLTDPDKRKEIQSKVDQLMKEYNELVLPAALAKIE